MLADLVLGACVLEKLVNNRMLLSLELLAKKFKPDGLECETCIHSRHKAHEHLTVWVQRCQNHGNERRLLVLADLCNEAAFLQTLHSGNELWLSQALPLSKHL